MSDSGEESLGFLKWAEEGNTVQKIFITWSNSDISGTVNYREAKLEGTSRSLWTNLLLKVRLIPVREVVHGLASSRF